MNSDKPQRPPSGLSPASRRLWAYIIDGWELDKHHLEPLEIFLRARDEARQAEQRIRREGLTITMPSGAQRPHPCLRVANEARSLALRALRELDLDFDRPAEAKRPPALLSIRGRHAS